MGPDRRGRRRLRRRGGQLRSERGMVTAETAMVLPALVVSTFGLLFVIGAVGAQLRCVDISREAVRELARGDSPTVVAGAVRAEGPPDARLTVSRSGANVTARVTAYAPVFGPLAGRLGRLEVSASSSALDETAIGAQP